MRRSGSTHDRGESLIELLVAVLIMGTTVVAVVGGLGTAIMMTDIHRKQATATAYLRELAANVDGAVVSGTPGYKACPAKSWYVAPYSPAPGYDAQITDVGYWNGTSFVVVVPSCNPANDLGVQRVSLSVTTTDGRVNERIDIVIRKPCRPTDTPLCA
jgi:Tfp pilus assembly protein PilV